MYVTDRRIEPCVGSKEKRLLLIGRHRIPSPKSNRDLIRVCALICDSYALGLHDHGLVCTPHRIITGLHRDTWIGFVFGMIFTRSHHRQGDAFWSHWWVLWCEVRLSHVLKLTPCTTGDAHRVADPDTIIDRMSLRFSFTTFKRCVRTLLNGFVAGS